jgi:hypothetical protein
MVQSVPKIEKRKLMTSGSSVVLTVPKEWLDENKLKAGEEVIMVMNGHLEFRKITEENVGKIRNQLNTQISPSAMDSKTARAM